MFRNRKLIRFAALFFVAELLMDVLLPVASYALTSGPTAPEATSFEPVDATDLVNLLTGDFAYNIPLIEVPGPGGGYPLALSYHAGIQPGEESSWTGLGWTLNPGAISRTVSGYPDDFNGLAGVDHAFWEGGESTTSQVGLSMPVYGYGNVHAQLSVSNDTYRGRNSNVDGGFKLNTGIFEVDEKNEVTGIQMPSVSYGGATLTASYSGPGNRIKTKVDHIYKAENLGSTIASFGASRISGGRVGMVSPFKKSSNSKSGKVTTKSKTRGVDISIYGFGVRAQKSYQRYWIDETASSKLFGTLYSPRLSGAVNNLAVRSFDNYDLPDQTTDFETVESPVDQMGGTYPDYDHYSVNAQGIGGSMRPYHFYDYLYRQTEQADGKVTTKSYSLGTSNKNAQFRFVGDFSNRLEFSENLTSMPDPFDFKITSGSQIQTGETGNEGYLNNHLAGSRHVVHYTNKEINAGNAATLVDCRAAGFDRTQLEKETEDQVGAFVVSNESGVKYHFALPAYSSTEYSYNGRKDVAGKDWANQYKRDAKYAYTWYLTAVTGPDYVDRNRNGLADDGDYGYWVSLEYGKWADSYIWRNPAEGFHRDLDQEWETAHKGKKELYYLNSIKTQSHTAIFVKEIRHDAKSVTTKKDEIVTIENRQVTFKDHGGFEPVRKFFYEGNRSRGNDYLRYPVSTMKLSAVYLFKNENFRFGDLSSSSGRYDDVFIYNYTDADGNPQQFTDRYHYGHNVIDVHDVENIQEDIKAASLKSFILETDYSLSPRTTNSFEPFAPRRSSARSGRLTLKSIRTRGKGGVEMMPATHFEYELDNVESSVVRFTKYDDNVVDVENRLAEGDIISFNHNSNTYYAVILQKQGNTMAYKFRLIHPDFGSGMFPSDFFSGGSIVNVNATRTKNPPFNAEMHDIWGFYKSDFDYQSASENYNFIRRTSDISAKSVDVWSLRTIRTAIGSKIRMNYETDYYDESVLGGKHAFRVRNVVKTGSNSIKIELFDEGFDLNKYLDTGGLIYFRVLASYDLDRHTFNGCTCGGVDDIYITKVIEGALQNATINTTDNTLSGTVDMGTMLKLTRSDISTTSKSTQEDCQIVDGTCNFTTSNGWPDFISGGLLELSIKGQYGGGIRVTDITVDNGFNQRKTVYTYEGGKTSYEPMGIYKPLINPAYLTEISGKTKAINEVTKRYKKAAMRDYSRLLNLSRELPGPEVLYNKVALREYVKEAGLDLRPTDQKAEYIFNTYEENNVRVNALPIPVTEGSDPVDQGDMTHSHVARDGVMIVDQTAHIGSLQKVTLYNSASEIISETFHDYIPDEQQELYRHQGVVQEYFTDARYVKQDGDKDIYYLRGMISGRTYVPSVQSSTTYINHKTGMQTTNRNLEFDFYSGATTKTVQSDSYGKYYLTKIIPAYRKYAGMGLALYGGDNMLVQTTANYSWAIEDDEEFLKTGLLSASVQEWSYQVPELEPSQSSTWRKKASYRWNGSLPLNKDGTYDTDDFVANEFNWTDPSLNRHWEKTGEVTLYDRYSHALEAKDINGDYASVRMGPDHDRVIASTSNARYNETAYSGAEFYSGNENTEGGVSRGLGGAPAIGRSHTGDFSLVVRPGGKGFTYTLDPGTADLDKKYLASVWVYLPGVAEDSEISEADLYYTINGKEVSISPEKGKNKAKSWYRLNLLIEPDGINPVEIACRNGTSRAIYFDDFRVYPLTAAMTTYVYDQQTDELTYMLDAENMYTRFEYDGMGRLIRTRKEHMNFDDAAGSVRAEQVVNEIIYNYGNK